MLKSYQWLLQRTRENQLRFSRGYAIHKRMSATLDVMKQKKNELVNPHHEKTNSL